MEIQSLLQWIREEEYDFDAILDDLDCNIEPNGFSPQQSNLYLFLEQHKQQEIFPTLYDHFIHVYNNNVR